MSQESSYQAIKSEEDDSFINVNSGTPASTQQICERLNSGLFSLKSTIQMAALTTIMLIALWYSVAWEQSRSSDAGQVKLQIVLDEQFENFLIQNGSELKFDFQKVFSSYQQVQFENKASSFSRALRHTIQRVIFGALPLDGSFLNDQDKSLLQYCSGLFTEKKEELQITILELSSLLEGILVARNDVSDIQLELLRTTISIKYQYLNSILRLMEQNQTTNELCSIEEQFLRNSPSVENLEQDMDKPSIEKEKLLQQEDNRNNVSQILQERSSSFKLQVFNDSHNKEETIQDLQMTIQSESEVRIPTSLYKQAQPPHFCDSCMKGDQGKSIHFQKSFNIETDNHYDLSKPVPQILQYLGASWSRICAMCMGSLSWLDQDIIEREIRVIQVTINELESRLHAGIVQLFRATLYKKEKNPEQTLIDVLQEDFFRRQNQVLLHLNLREKQKKLNNDEEYMKNTHKVRIIGELKDLIDGFFTCIQ